MDATLAAMGAAWNRPPLRLHYVTAREAFNVAKAAEAGHAGNPADYRDFVLPPPANRRLASTAPWRLRSYSTRRVEIDVPGDGPVRLEFADGELRGLEGRLRRVAVRYRGGAVERIEAVGGPVRVEPPHLAPLVTAPQAVTAPA
jgi:hypothetical protein